MKSAPKSKIQTQTQNKFNINNSMDIEENKPKLTNKQLAIEMALSDSTVERYRYGMNIDSPYSRHFSKKDPPKTFCGVS